MRFDPGRRSAGAASGGHAPAGAAGEQLHPDAMGGGVPQAVRAVRLDQDAGVRRGRGGAGGFGTMVREMRLVADAAGGYAARWSPTVRCGGLGGNTSVLYDTAVPAELIAIDR